MVAQSPTRTGKDDETSASSTEKPQSKKKKRRSRWRLFGAFVLVIAIILGIGRAILPWSVRSYVNRTIDRSPLYDGMIGDVEIHLWRGAYSIDEVRIVKTTGSVPVPLFAAKRIDLAIEWPALLDGELVGQVVMSQPELNFVDAASERDAQTGAGGPWMEILRDLFPFKINSIKIHDASVHFRTFATKQPVDVYLSELEGSIDNLTNIRDEINPLVTTVTATGLAMDQAKFEYQMKLNPFTYRPTFHLAARVLGLDVTKTNDLARAYGAFDFESGWFDLVIEMDVKEGQLEGYVKPLFRNLKVFSLTQDGREDNVLELFWEALFGAASNLLKNPPRDQVATVIPFRGEISGPQTDNLAAIGNFLRNAFIRAYLPKLQTGEQGIEGMEFGPASLSDPIHVGD